VETESLCHHIDLKSGGRILSQFCSPNHPLEPELSFFTSLQQTISNSSDILPSSDDFGFLRNSIFSFLPPLKSVFLLAGDEIISLDPSFGSLTLIFQNSLAAVPRRFRTRFGICDSSQRNFPKDWKFFVNISFRNLSEVRIECFEEYDLKN
jgi:hypothetical protein